MPQWLAHGYAALLAEAFARTELNVEQLMERTGLGRTTLWRLLNNKPDASIDAAQKLRDTLAGLHEENQALPPPVEPVENLQHWEWMQLGRELLKDPELMSEITAAVRKRLKGRALVAEAEKDLGLGSHD